MRRRRLLAALALLLCPAARAAPPEVAATLPDDGDVDVDPAVAFVRIEFDQPMDRRGRSIVGGGDAFPQVAGPLAWADGRTLVMPVRLVPGHEYAFSVNSDTFKGFRNRAGEPAEWYPVRFHTRAADAPPAKPDVTPDRNRRAVTALRQSIDRDYAYRDLRRVDWAKELDARQAELEAAPTANAFARLTAHLLRLARDAHVSVRAGDVRLGTRANSAPPNFDFGALSQTVRGWAEQPSGLATARLDRGGGYVAVTACTAEQAAAFDAAVDGMTDATYLVVDLRANGGGDETAALKMAGRFADKAAVYSKDRIRADGRWSGPFDRTIEPRADRPRFARPVAVLVGPKVVSSGESFALMLRHGGHAKLFGATTGGSSGRPLPHDLGNGVTVFLSSWEDQLPDGTPLQNHGVVPDVPVETTPQGLRSSDSVLAAAVAAVSG